VRFLVLALSLIALTACHRTDPPGEAPTGVKAVAGDGLVVVSWDTLPDLTYWIFYAKGASVGVGTAGTVAIRRAVPPRVIGNLGNGALFSFIMNATQNDSPAGPTSAAVFQSPRLAGETDSWTSGPALGAPSNLKSAAFSGGRFVVVGDAATIFAGDYNYTSDFSSPPGVTAPGVTVWLQPVVPPGTTFPLAPAANLSSVIFNGSFIALARDNPLDPTTSPVISSADGLNNWTANKPVPAPGMNAIGFGSFFGVPTYVAVGDGGRIFTTNNIDVNDTTTPWTAATSPTFDDLNSISLLNSQFIVTGASGTLLAGTFSSNGISWTALNSGTGSTLRGATFTPLGSGAHYVAVGDGGVITTSDINGVNWTAITLPAPAPDLRSVTIGGASGTRFLAVGPGGAVVFSDTGLGLDWSVKSAGLGNTANLASVLAVPAMYLAVGDGGANVVSR
jgi:photosystem II stability/assembly factor-like uncharacterized protein